MAIYKYGSCFGGHVSNAMQHELKSIAPSSDMFYHKTKNELIFLLFIFVPNTLYRLKFDFNEA